MVEDAAQHGSWVECCPKAFTNRPLLGDTMRSACSSSPRMCICQHHLCA